MNYFIKKLKSLTLKRLLAVGALAGVLAMPLAGALAFRAHGAAAADVATPPVQTVLSRNELSASDRAAMEADFDAFLDASAAGLSANDSKYNAVVAVYAAIGITMSTAQAASANANYTRDLLAKISSRDSQSALSGGWTLALSTANFDGLSLSYLKFLRFFTNLTTINFVAQNATAVNRAAFAIGSLADIDWIGSLVNLKSLTIVNNYARNPSPFASQGLSFLANLPLATLNISRFLYLPGGASTPRPIFTTLDLSKAWFDTMPYDMAIVLPAAFPITAVARRYSVTDNRGVNIQVNKTIAPPIKDPTPGLRRITIAGNVYDAVLSNSKLIWPLNQTQITNARYVDRAGSYYTTNASDPSLIPVSPRFLTVDEIALYDNYRTESQVPATQLMSNVVLNESNATLATFAEVIQVDGLTVPRVMQNGILYWAFDQRTIRYRNFEYKKFWTTYERINPTDLNDPAQRIQTIDPARLAGLNNLSDVTVKTIVPPTEAADTIAVDNKPIQALKSVTDDGYFWDFARAGFKPEQFLFYSALRKKIFTSVAALIRALVDDKSLTYASFSSLAVKSFVSVPLDMDVADLPKDIIEQADVLKYLNEKVNRTVKIDYVPAANGVPAVGEYGYVLRNGRFYIDYEAIDAINFVVTVADERFYYTTEAKIPQAQKAGARLLPRIPARVVPKPVAISRPNATTTPSLTVDNTTVISYAINEGALYWRFSGTSLAQKSENSPWGMALFKYAENAGDKRGIYYYTGDWTALDPAVVFDRQVTEVYPVVDQASEDAVRPYISKLLTTAVLTKENYREVLANKAVYVDGATNVYERHVAGSNVYWVSRSGSLLQVANVALQSYRLDPDTSGFVELPDFFTSLLNAATRAASFPAGIRQIVGPTPAANAGSFTAATIAPVVLADPTSASDRIRIHSGNEVLEISAKSTTSLETPFVWSNIDLVRSVKFADTFQDAATGQSVTEYYVDINDNSFANGRFANATDVVVTANEALVVEDAKRQDNVFETAAAKYAIIAVFAALAAGTVGFMLWKVLRK